MCGDESGEWHVHVIGGVNCICYYRSEDKVPHIKMCQYRTHAYIIFAEDLLAIQLCPQDTLPGWNVCDCRASDRKAPLWWVRDKHNALA